MFSETKKLTRRLWASVAASGIISIIFGLVAIFNHDIIIAAFSILLIAVSVVGLVASIKDSDINPFWWLPLVISIAGLVVGIFLLREPNTANMIIAYVIAIYILCQSAFDLVTASHARTSNNSDRAIMFCAGVIGVIFGVIALFCHDLTADIFFTIIGIYAIVHGIIIEYYAGRTKHEINQVKRGVKRAMKDMEEALGYDDEDDRPKKSSAARAKKAKTAKTTKAKKSTSSKSKKSK